MKIPKIREWDEEHPEGQELTYGEHAGVTHGWWLDLRTWGLGLEISRQFGNLAWSNHLEVLVTIGPLCWSARYGWNAPQRGPRLVLSELDEVQNFHVPPGSLTLSWPRSAGKAR